MSKTISVFCFNPKIKRSSKGEYGKGSEKLEATHGIQHKAGLREIYTLDRSTISGEHRNSEKYGSFSGSGGHTNFFKLTCKVLKSEKIKDKKYTYFVDVDYVVNFNPSH